MKLAQYQRPSDETFITVRSKSVSKEYGFMSKQYNGVCVCSVYYCVCVCLCVRVRAE